MDAWDTIGLCLALTGGIGLLHTYLSYPLWWRLRNEPVNELSTPNQGAKTDSISIIVAAFNEENHIGQRIQNLLESDYPANLLEIIIASDGSTDRTVEIARERAQKAPNVKILAFSERRGKISVLNDACNEAKGSILAFSDANVEFASSAISELAASLGGKGVGCACGKLVFRSPTGAIHEQSEGLYWKLETWLKTREGAEGALLGANGAIYALKADLWTPCPPDTLVDDFFIPMRLLMKGHKVVYAPKAIAEEDLPPKLEDEFGRRIRIGAGNFQALVRCLPLLNPRKGLAAWVFFSHKVLRWLGPFLMISLLAGSTILAFKGSSWATMVVLAQVCFYSLAALGLTKIRIRGVPGRVVGIATHFVAMNAALFVGFFRWIVGRQRVTWNRTQR